MSIEPLPSTSNQPIHLGKLATILAAVCGITFGLCSVNFVSANYGVRWSDRVMPLLMGTSLVIEALCLLGLVAVGVAAIVRASSSKSPD